MNRLYILFVLAIAVQSCGQSTKKQVQYANAINFVDPFIGTGGHGHTYPGCSAPFGMMQLSPDTRLEGWDGCSGYHYSDSIIYGFSHTHLSGTGVADYCDLLLMPMSGDVQYSNDPKQSNSYPSAFKKSSEKASPGYYSVFLDDHEIAVELTCLKRSGVHHYKYPGPSASLLIDLVHRDEVLNSGIRKLDSFTVTGFRISSSWAEEQHLYFALEFSRPIIEMEIVTAAESEPVLISTHEGKFIKTGLKFQSDISEDLLVRVGISAVSEEGALLNLHADEEVANKSFSEVREKASLMWESQLSKIRIASKDDDVLTNFYTALYHSYLSPDLFTDVDGQYRGTDLKVHTADTHQQYTVFSLWDTYRAAHPLYAILNRKESRDFATSFLQQYKDGGRLPVWELAANYTGCMIAYHSVPVLYDAYQKGIITEEKELALKAMLDIARSDELGKHEYAEYGYIPAQYESESVSKTLEYALDDWCISKFANSIGKTNVASEFHERSQFYKNVFDPSSGFMRARVNGGWFDPFMPEEVNFNYTEANAWQYNFYVPHDIYGHIDLYGSDAAFTEVLDSLFSVSSKTSGREQADITGLIGQYAHGNEPSHHIAYLYAYVNQASKTQKLTRQIMETLYKPNPDGLSGNEDCGQMSAWYVFSSLGFYPVNPASNTYILGSPIVDSAEMALENGNTFRVSTIDNSKENIYVKAVRWNQEAYVKPFITYEMIQAGGELEFVMTSQPVVSTYEDKIPDASISSGLITETPFVLNANRTFISSMEISLAHINDDAMIMYSLNDQDPVLYSGPIKINNDARITAFAEVTGTKSKLIKASFKKMKEERSIQLSEEYASQYSAGGNSALIDLLRGTNDFRTGDWQGYRGVDLTATIDLGVKQRVSSVDIGCLQDWNSWIFMPEKLSLSVSKDGKSYKKVSGTVNKIDEKAEGCIIQDLHLRCDRDVRFLRLEIISKKTNPEWHRAPGDACWIFLDEIVINN